MPDGNFKNPATSPEVAMSEEIVAKPMTREEVLHIVETVIGSMQGDLTASEVKLYSELDALASFIQKARNDIAAIRPDRINRQHIPSATDELDAIVGATEKATGSILDSVEIFEDAASHLEGEIADKANEAVMNIYEACNFQDITGQRITKVVNALKDIEGRVSSILTKFGEEIGVNFDELPDDEDDKVECEKDAGRSLAEGPQLDGAGMDQASIDALLDDLF
ncbi:MAG: hypothetical protein Alpg2KO_13390 [Alphaproteobacteria bacterium]